MNAKIRHLRILGLLYLTVFSISAVGCSKESQASRKDPVQGVRSDVSTDKNTDQNDSLAEEGEDIRLSTSHQWPIARTYAFMLQPSEPEMETVYIIPPEPIFHAIQKVADGYLLVFGNIGGPSSYQQIMHLKTRGDEFAGTCAFFVKRERYTALDGFPREALLFQNIEDIRLDWRKQRMEYEEKREEKWKLLCKSIDDSRKSIHIAAGDLGSVAFVQSILTARKRGVHVVIVTHSPIANDSRGPMAGGGTIRKVTDSMRDPQLEKLQLLTEGGEFDEHGGSIIISVTIPIPNAVIVIDRQAIFASGSKNLVDCSLQSSPTEEAIDRTLLQIRDWASTAVSPKGASTEGR